MDNDTGGWQALSVFLPSVYSDLDEDTGGGCVEIVAAFLPSARARCEAIVAAIAAGDAPELKRQAHALKGSSRVLGLERLAALCERLEVAAAEGHGLAVWRQPVEAEVAAAIAALENHLGQG